MTRGSVKGERKNFARKATEKLVLWAGIAVMGILLIPAVIFLCGVYFVWSLAELVLKKLDAE